MRPPSVGQFQRPAQQLDVEPAACEQHIVERFADIAGFDGRAAVARDAGLGDAPHQLLDERGADAFGPLRGLAYDGFAERQASAIKLDQLRAADIVRKRHLDRLVDTAGAIRQGALKLLRPVGGEDEQDVRILLQSIHFVEQPVEQRFLARSHLVPIARNEIGIRYHDVDIGEIEPVKCLEQALEQNKNNVTSFCARGMCALRSFSWTRPASTAPA
jgi:hypothetical protein